MEEVQDDIKTSDECIEHSRSADISVAALKRSSESCEKGNILMTAKQEALKKNFIRDFLCVCYKLYLHDCTFVVRHNFFLQQIWE